MDQNSVNSDKKLYAYLAALVTFVLALIPFVLRWFLIRHFAQSKQAFAVLAALVLIYGLSLLSFTVVRLSRLRQDHFAQLPQIHLTMIVIIYVAAACQTSLFLCWFLARTPLLLM